MGLKRKDQPIIIGITGHVLAQFTKKGIDAGMDEVLSKPCYIETIHKVLEKYNLLNDPQNKRKWKDNSCTFSDWISDFKIKY